jgi:uncharacterized protein GlcG (DUF336 family)
MSQHTRKVTWIAGLVVVFVAALSLMRTSHVVVAQDEPPREVMAKSPGDALQVTDISAEQAHQVLAAAVAKAEEIDTRMDIAVVDAGGNLKAFLRMDGAWLGSIDIAIKKAKTARYFDMPTGEIGKLSQPGESLYNIEHSNDGLITFPGGVPLTDGDGNIIGAVGVSGSSVEDDHEVATAGAEALE